VSTISSASHPRSAAALLLLGLAGLAGVPASAQLPSANVIHVALIGERDSIAPGQRSWVAVRFRLDPGWHIYWINPGDSGDPPRVEWRLPAGFRAGPLQWPHPERLVTKYAVDFGYADEVLLLAPIRAPTNLAPGSQAELAGTVKWVVCREVCIPGKTEVALSLPVKRSAAAPPNKIFDEARRRVPEPLPAGWRARAHAESNDFVLSIETGQPIAQAAFFPLQPGQIENAAPQTVSALARGVQLRLKKSDQLLKPIAVLNGVIVLPSGKAYVIDAPVTAAGSGTSSKVKTMEKKS
jgi:DsbC/DsbD-like thiol-disulfide interchange protein